MVNGGFHLQNLSRQWRELKLHVIDLKEHSMLLHFTSQETFSTESSSVNDLEACKKKTVYCTCSLIYT